MSAYRAALEAADEIGLAVIAITLNIIAMFVPVSFMGGIAGQYFKQFGLVVAVAVFFSLLVTRLITPLLAAYFLRASAPSEAEGWLLRTYTRVVRWSGPRLADFRRFDRQFLCAPLRFPSRRRQLESEQHAGAVLGLASRGDQGSYHKIVRKLRARSEVASVSVDGGRVMGSGRRCAKATLVINLVAKEHRKLLSNAKSAPALATCLDIRYWFLKDNRQRQFQLVVAGRDAGAVTQAAAELTGQAKRIGLLANVVSTGLSCA